MQDPGLRVGQGSADCPAESRPIRGIANQRGTGDLGLHDSGPEGSQPVAPDVRRLRRGTGKRSETERLDHLTGVGPPEPDPAGDDRVRRRLGERAGGERHAIGDQPFAEPGQESLGAGHRSGLVNEPGEGGGQLHRRGHPVDGWSG